VRRLWIVLASGCAAALTGCLTEARIDAMLVAANTCQTVDDCVSIGNVCPFGCNLYVHADDADRIRQVLADYQDRAESCSQECQPSTRVECEDFVCTPAFGDQ
jgi:hypothetical protein